MLTHGPRQAHVWLIFDVRQNFVVRSIDMDFVYKEVSDLPADAFSDFSACFWRRFEIGHFAGEAFFAKRSNQVSRKGEGKSRVAAKRFQQTSAEPLACFVRRSMRCSFKVFTSRLSGRAPARSLALPSRSATSSGMNALEYQRAEPGATANAYACHDLCLRTARAKHTRG